MDSTKNQEKKQGEKQFSVQPVETNSGSASAFSAHPGPAVQKDMPQQEGTKEERLAKMEAMNK